jgi:hypothetical protein
VLFCDVLPNGTEIWRWSDERAFTQASTELVIQAGETVQVSALWDQSLIGGGIVSMGDYIAYGSLVEQSPEANYQFSIQ